MNLKKRYEEIINEYCDKFCGDDYYISYWVGDRIGGICEVSDAFLNFSDIKYCVDNDIDPDKLIIDYNDYALAEKKPANFESWLKLGG